jgi:broad specificity phosphatase PhoE
MEPVLAKETFALVLTSPLNARQGDLRVGWLRRACCNRGEQGNVVLFAHGHLLRVLAARWLGLPARAGRHFLLDTGTLNILSSYDGIPAIKGWNWAVE